MVPLNTIDADSHSALDVILADYLKAVEVGQPPDRGEMLARHGELADELAEFFAGFDQFDQFAAPLRAVRQSAVSSIQEGATLARCAVDTVSDPRQTAPYHPPPSIHKICESV